MTFTPPPTFSPGTTATAANWNTYVRDNTMHIASKCLLYYTLSFAVGAGVTAQHALDHELYDSGDNMGDTTLFRITFKRSGNYRVRTESPAPTGGGWTQFVKKNGSSTLMSKAASAGQEIYMDAVWSFAVSDFIELWVTVGGSNITAVANLSQRPSGVFQLMLAEWVSP